MSRDQHVSHYCWHCLICRSFKYCLHAVISYLCLAKDENGILFHTVDISVRRKPKLCLFSKLYRKILPRFDN